jgi:hypothetical protein
MGRVTPIGSAISTVKVTGVLEPSLGQQVIAKLGRLDVRRAKFLDIWQQQPATK